MNTLSRLACSFAAAFALTSLATAQEIGVEYCTSQPNSTGQIGKLRVFGIAQPSVGIIALAAEQCPPNQPAMFFYGPNPTVMPFADGTLCISGSNGGITRVLPPAQLDANGAASIFLPSQHIGVPPGGPPGNLTVNYQMWFRDPAALGSGSNLTSAAAVQFEPCFNCE